MKKAAIIAFALLSLAACNKTPRHTPFPQLKWNHVQTGTGTYNSPITQLMLTESGGTKALATQTCTGIAGDATDITGALAAVRCWWAGGGDDYAAFASGTGFIIRHRTLDEEAGAGEWREIR
ncbi:MAG TPA: hypothetical protein VHA78_00665 [Candidatus Peribacteraceae bacterium]|nr:hypothetical protein [Candidatus Peribacteraceae bacterium]